MWRIGCFISVQVGVSGGRIAGSEVRVRITAGEFRIPGGAGRFPEMVLVGSPNLRTRRLGSGKIFLRWRWPGQSNSASNWFRPEKFGTAHVERPINLCYGDGNRLCAGEVSIRDNDVKRVLSRSPGVPVVTSPARWYEAKITPLGEVLHS